MTASNAPSVALFLICSPVLNVPYLSSLIGLYRPKSEYAAAQLTRSRGPDRYRWIVTRSRSAPEAPPRQLTARGLATRARIVDAAADLMYVKGVNATTLDDVRAASSTSKSQLYQHFADKDQLVRAVVSRRAGQVLEREQGYLERLRSFRGLQRWRDALVQRNALQNGAYGCALGSMASELSDQDDEARRTLAEAFAEWTGLIAAGLRRMQDGGSLSKSADPDKLAVGLMAALQGGYLLAETQHDITPMETALDMALDHIRSFLTK
ncbi:TetR/AcrR family transcriptional regulator [Kribbella jiaozuonensis]|uniref:TetR/AcrR family transcriptional regulator n=1 Tax=Kribbella jiaozuonensis TaxID=2575441 RepID=A0A4U3M145_9ACTN|nr:TetR/AcrR family transcriptional regulator [Kribbella jiaozuonensis]